jgi:WD40 repeat protein
MSLYTCREQYVKSHEYRYLLIFLCYCIFLDDVLERMMDARTSADMKSLIGHSGPVYATDISQDKKFLISSSEDGCSEWIISLC